MDNKKKVPSHSPNPPVTRPDSGQTEANLSSINRDQVIKLLEERGDATYILDRGLIQFGKFAIALLAMFGVIGVFFFGLDIKKASEEAKKANEEAKQTHLQMQTIVLELNETKAKLLTAKNEMEQSKAIFAGFVSDSQNELRKILDEASASRTRTFGIEQDTLGIQLRVARLAESVDNVKGVAALAASTGKSAPKGELPAGTLDKPIRIAIVSEAKELRMTDLQKVAAALQQQVSRDLEPIWHVQALIETYKSMESIPPGYWPIIVKKDIGLPGAIGIHADKSGQPYALVTYEPTLNWSVTASHELLGMLVDPFGNRVLTGPSPDPTQNGKRVSLVVEICQPVQGNQYAYQIDGVSVSDFVTPEFFDVTKKEGGKYSFRGSVAGPLKVAKNGYLSWFDDEKEWYQLTWFGADKPVVRKLGKIDL